MAFVKLSIPAIVKEQKIDQRSQYYIRPVFVGYPIAINHRYEQAISIFQKEVKNRFKGFSLSRNNAVHLQWYLFRPELTYKVLSLDLKVGSQFIKGLFGMALFEVQNKLFLHFPDLNYTMMCREQNPQALKLEEEARRGVQFVLKGIKESEGHEFEPEQYFSGKRDFLIDIPLTVNIGFEPFQFEKSGMDWLFASLGGDHEFDGAIEVERVGQDLNSLYPSELRRAYLQDTLVDRLHGLIYHSNNTPIAIVGPTGVGKHTLLHEVIARYEERYYGKRKGRKSRTWHIDPNRIIAGMNVVGWWQKRFESIIRFIQQPNDLEPGPDRMLIDNPIAMLRIGKSGQNDMTLSDVLRPYLEKRSLQLTLIATPEEWKVLQELDRRFSDLFQVIRVHEPDIETATRIVLERRKILEQENGTIVTIQAVNQLFTLQRNYLKNKPLPGSVMRLMQQLAVKYRFKRIDAPQVRDEFKSLSGLEERIFDSSQQLEPNEVVRSISQQLVGQEAAVKALTETVHIAKAKLADKTKPLSSFLFIGPTGVGKTQAAKVLCNYLMGSEDQLMRFDMNEYIDGGAVSRLIGDYANPEGQLTGKVRYQPFGILLLDEIEKAHPDVHDLLLQVLDDGRLTDSLGRTVDFTNTIIIMTSNIGAEQVSAQVGFDFNRNQSAIYEKAVENFFRPEFINRIDQIVIFKPLEIAHILGIARLQIKELLQRDGFVRRTTILNISKEALEWVAKRGYDPTMGGRALKRQIERDLTALSAEQLISTHTDQPIIFDIILKEDQLVPVVTPLDFVTPYEEDWLPQFPGEHQGRRFYNKLLREMENIERQIKRFEGMDEEVPEIKTGSGDLDWQHYDFKNRIAEIKDHVTKIMLSFHDRPIPDPPVKTFRLKRAYLFARKDYTTKGVRENFKDRLFQQEALRELTETYNLTDSQFDRLNSEFIDNYVTVALAKLATKGFLDQYSQRVTLSIEAVISDSESRGIPYLLDLYQSFFESLDIQHEVDEEQHKIMLEGYQVYELLQNEHGIHLFYVAHQTPYPFKVKVERRGQKQASEGPLKVIRIYDDDQTLTDLRTGYSNSTQITPQEFKLLVYGGLPKELRTAISG
jgi:ATP-dependent Clp protease ATP-binding subunit ClpC